jgi:hypothetical protein
LLSVLISVEKVITLGVFRGILVPQAAYLRHFPPFFVGSQLLEKTGEHLGAFLF